MKYKNYVLDMGKVLVDYDAHLACAKYTNNKELIEKAFNIVFQSYEWPYLDCGLITFEQAWNQINKRIKDDELRKVCHDAFFNWEKIALWPIEGMEDVVKKLKNNGVSVYILSNIPESILNVDKQIIPGYNLFDGIFYSFQHGVMKPQIEIFEKFLKYYNLKAQECIFIDDIEWNVEAAKKTGMSGYVHKNCNVDELKKFLEI